MTSPALDQTVITEFDHLFKAYFDEFKELEAGVVSKRGERPVQILIEIRNCFDHVSRCFQAGVSDEDCVNTVRRAQAHMTRAILDCYKTLLFSHKDSIERFEQKYKNIDLTVADNGSFRDTLDKLVQTADDLAEHARKREAKALHKEECYKDYKEAYVAYRDVEQFMISHADSIAFAVKYGRKKSKREWWFMIGGAVLGAILSQMAQRWFGGQ